MTNDPEGDRLSPDDRFQPSASSNRKAARASRNAASRRVVSGLLLLVALTTFAVGSIQQQWLRVYAFSSQICLSCMGLV